jgi:hypothetical protein
MIAVSTKLQIPVGHSRTGICPCVGRNDSEACKRAGRGHAQQARALEKPDRPGVAGRVGWWREDQDGVSGDRTAGDDGARVGRDPRLHTFSFIELLNRGRHSAKAAQYVPRTAARTGAGRGGSQGGSAEGFRTEKSTRRDRPGADRDGERVPPGRPSLESGAGRGSRPGEG